MSNDSLEGYVDIFTVFIVRYSKCRLNKYDALLFSFSLYSSLSLPSCPDPAPTLSSRLSSLALYCLCPFILHQKAVFACFRKKKQKNKNKYHAWNPAATSYITGLETMHRTNTHTHTHTHTHTLHMFYACRPGGERERDASSSHPSTMGGEMNKPYYCTVVSTWDM